MNKLALTIITFGLVVGLSIIFLSDPKNSVETELTESEQNVEIKNGIQYITIDAKGGYSPRVSSAQADIPTKLIVKTDGTYDCSSALVVRSVGFQKILEQTGEEVIDIGVNKKGTSLQGSCSMGMYSFVVNFM